MRMTTQARIRFAVMVVVFGGLGIAAAVFILANQRFPNPLRDTYVVRAKLTEANGIVGGIGQPVNVAGVRVGSVVKTSHDRDGNAVIELEIHRDDLRHVYRDARVAIEPITPLKDMQVNLDPGTPRAAELPDGGLVGLRHTTVPVPLDTLLGGLDVDTRQFLATLISSVADGTRDRAPDLRRALRSFGPTTHQVGEITKALEGRRSEIARLVHNLGIVTNAAADDRQLATLVREGERTLSAIASQEAPLRDAITRLPGTLDQAHSTLARTARFAEQLTPTLNALDPSTRRLASTLRQLRPFTTDATKALQRDVRPLVRSAVPAVDAVGTATKSLTGAMPQLFDGVQGLRYLLNALAYNPPGKDEGGLFWASWFAHNFNSVFGLGEAHGGAGRASVLLSCQQITNTLELGQIVKLLTGSPNVCPTK